MVQTKRKKASKDADFQKKKLKVGKGTLKASGDNATDTSFKARTIKLATQNIGLEKKGAVTQRKQNINDLLTQLNHPAKNVKKDAFVGLKDLVEMHPEETIAHHLPILIKLTMPSILDDVLSSFICVLVLFLKRGVRIDLSEKPVQHFTLR